MPSKTTQQLGATRRNARRHQPSLEAASRELEVRLTGSLGPAAHTVLQQLMQVVEAKVNFRMVETPIGMPDPSLDPVASWSWAGSYDPTALPGQLRLHLLDEGQVRAVRQQLHGRAIQVGSDLISIDVSSDLSPQAARDSGKNGRRGGRSRRGPTPQ